MNDKIKLLAEYLDVDPSTIEVSNYDDNTFVVDNGDEWMVLTEDESYDKFKEWEMSLIDEMGLEAFSENFQEHILETCINERFFKTVAEEESMYYIDEMDSEELLEYAHERGLYEDIESVDDAEFDEQEGYIRNDCEEVYEEEILNRGMAEYFEEIYGRNWANEMKDTLQKEIDWDKVIDELYNWDTKETLHGSMASYDGQEHEFGQDSEGNWVFGYWVN